MQLVNTKLPLSASCLRRKKEWMKSKRRYESDTLGKLLFIGFCFKKKNKAYTHWVQQIKSPKVISKQLHLEYRASEFFVRFFFTILHLNQSGNGIFYKLCKNLINTKSQKGCKGHQKNETKQQQQKKEHDVNFMLLSLLLYTIYNWSFVSFSSLMTTVLHRLKVGDK